MKYFTVQIAALGNLTDAFRNIIKLSKYKPGTFSFAFFVTKLFIYNEPTLTK